MQVVTIDTMTYQNKLINIMCLATSTTVSTSDDNQYLLTNPIRGLNNAVVLLMLQSSFKQVICYQQREKMLTMILNLQRRDAASAKQPYSQLSGLYFGTQPSAPVHRNTFSMLQIKESPRFCTGSTMTRPQMMSPTKKTP